MEKSSKKPTVLGTIPYPSTAGKVPEGKEAVLQVRDLSISFKTDDGFVRAVRGVAFDLYKEETLCIVGESGSGKSVTNKAIMGISAKSAHIDSGSILYEGEDLTKVSEDEFHKIRGTKIGMIFQDPLSSLNPIMKIGKQITEVMIANGDHLEAYRSELVSKEFIQLKNDQRLLQIVKDDDKRAMAEAKAEQKRLRRLAKVGEKDIKAIDSNIQSLSEERAKLSESEAKRISKLDAAIAKEEAKKALLVDAMSAEGGTIEEKLAANERKQAEIKTRSSEKKAELSAKIKEDKAIYRAANKQAKAKVKEKKKDIVSRHKANNKPIIARLKKPESRKQAFNDYLSEHRRYLSELRVTHKEAKEKALKIMAEVGIPNPELRFNQYPFEFSGGMRQRIVIAIALTADPDILICDEPTTALDVTIQAQILELINRLKRDRHMSVIFITHDLGVVANMADRVAVMYAGKIVEFGTAQDVFYAPAHPYTWALLSSIPDVDSKEELEAIPGTPPNMLYPPKGDAFAQRNRYALGIDFKEQPPMFQLSETHYAATWLLDERAPIATMPKIVSTRIKNSLEAAKKYAKEEEE